MSLVCYLLATSFKMETILAHFGGVELEIIAHVFPCTLCVEHLLISFPRSLEYNVTF